MNIIQTKPCPPANFAKPRVAGKVGTVTKAAAIAMFSAFLLTSCSSNREIEIEVGYTVWKGGRETGKDVGARIVQLEPENSVKMVPSESKQIEDIRDGYGSVLAIANNTEVIGRCTGADSVEAKVAVDGKPVGRIVFRK